MSRLLRSMCAAFVFGCASFLSASANAQEGTFSINLFGQWAWTDIDFAETAPGPPVVVEQSDGDIDGAGAGIGVGYDFNLNNGFVLGVVGDIAIGDWKTSYNNSSTQIGFYEIDYIGTIRARLGYQVGPNVLVYGTGGYAFAKVEHGGVVVAPAVAQQIKYTADGWTIGIGGEMDVGAVSLFAEFLHIDFSTGGFTLHNERHDVDLDTNTIRAGVKLKLN